MKIKSSVSGKLLKVVFSLYVLIAGVMIAKNVVDEFNSTRAKVISDLSLFHETFQQPIAKSVWNLDHQQLISTLEGMQKLPAIVAVEFIPSREGEGSVYLGKKALKNKIPTASDSWFTKEYPLTYTTKEGDSFGKIGTMKLYANQEYIISKTKEEFYSVMVNFVIITTALWFSFTVAFRKILAVPLLNFTETIAKIDPNQVEQRKVCIKASEGSELKILESAFNNLLAKIAATNRENNVLNQDLKSLNKDLEVKIQQRTEELREAQNKLLAAAHKSGMSQVASEVLHNVGNVLNSLVMATANLRKKIDKQSIAKAEQVMDLLAEKVVGKEGDPIVPDMVKFLKVYLKKSGQDVERIEQLINQMDKFIVHIKSVVNMQKASAHTTDMETLVKTQNLIDDALHLSGVKNCSGIKIELDDRRGYVLFTNEHKVLQVLVNILVNAKQALKAADISSKTLKISQDVVGDELQITVSDNGVGIDKAIAERIFQSGFTTKDDGSGLGLHNSANSIKSIGGSIECLSEGVNQGATFVVRLPYKERKLSA